MSNGGRIAAHVHRALDYAHEFAALPFRVIHSRDIGVLRSLTTFVPVDHYGAGWIAQIGEIGVHANQRYKTDTRKQ